MDPKGDLRDFLQTNLDTSEMSVPMNATEDIVFADYDGGPGPYPNAAIVSKDAVVPGGGQTGATGIDPQDGSPIQDTIYTVQVDCWGGPDDAKVYTDHGSHPDVVANELGEAVADACRVGHEGAPDGYEWLFAAPPYEADDTEESPTNHREIVVARLKVTY
jgi:hypothetical protein